MALEERTQLATEGIVVAAVEVARPAPARAAPDAAASEQVQMPDVAAQAPIKRYMASQDAKIPKCSSYASKSCPALPGRRRREGLEHLSVL